MNCEMNFETVPIVDDFVTPSSTPPGEQSKAATSEESNVFTQDLSDAAIHDKIYDKLVNNFFSNFGSLFTVLKFKVNSFILPKTSLP